MYTRKGMATAITGKNDINASTPMYLLKIRGRVMPSVCQPPRVSAFVYTDASAQMHTQRGFCADLLDLEVHGIDDGA
jgi:hypothetical protein